MVEVGDITTYLATFLLVCLSGLFSGLTLGLLGLDTNQLRIVLEAGTPTERKYARRIWPLRKRGNLLLVTLLLGNTVVNAQLSILLADLTSGVLGLVLSTSLIVVFGEIGPQAACSRFALLVGYRTAPLVRAIVIIMYPLAFPISKVLDWTLGEELGKLYTEAEFERLIESHSGIISAPRRAIMQGALALRDTLVEDIMTPAERMFTVCQHDRLDFDMLTQIFQSGFSRIPVREAAGSDHFIGMLLAKDLMLIVPADSVPVSAVVTFFGRERVTVVDEKARLEEVLKQLSGASTHFGIVRGVDDSDPERDPVYRTVGCVTMEDVLEEILQMELVDETDAFVDNTHSAAATDRPEHLYAPAALRLLDRSRGHNDLHPAMVRAIAATLSTSVRAFSAAGKDGTPMPLAAIEELVQGSRVLDLVRPDDNGAAASSASSRALTGSMRSPSNTPLGTGMQGSDKHIPSMSVHDLYTRGERYTVATMVLSGELEVESGADGIPSVSRTFEVLASRALICEPGEYLADFTARLRSPTARVLRIALDEYRDALRFGRLPLAQTTAAEALPTEISPAKAGEALLRPASGHAAGDGTALLTARDQVPASSGPRAERLSARPGIDGTLAGLQPRASRGASAAGESAAAIASGALASAAATTEPEQVTVRVESEQMPAQGD